MATKQNSKLTMTTKNKRTILGVGMCMIVVCMLFAISLAQIAFAATTDSTNDLSVLKIDFLNQQPDPASPGAYVDLRWRVTNLGNSAQDYVFKLDPQYPFSFDNPADATITQSSVTGYQATTDGAILYYRVRVADDAVEGDANVIKLNYYRADGVGGSSQISQVVRIESRQGLVNIDNVSVNPTQVSIGSVFNVSFAIENFGTNYISNLQVALNTDGTGLAPYGGSNQKTLSQLAGKNSAIFTFQYFAGTSAPVNVIMIPVRVTYYDSLGRQNNVSTSIGVKIGADSSYFANLDSSEVYLPATKGKVVVSISNTGQSDINFAVVQIEETPDYVVVGPMSSYLGNLKSDDLQTGQFDIYVKPTNASTVPLKFLLTYKDVYNQAHTDEFTLNNRLYDAALAQKVGLMPTASYTGLIIIVVIVVAIVGFVMYRRRKKNVKVSKQ